MSISEQKPSRLGFGVMRLPEKEGKPDLETACRLVDEYLAAGMNYIDTAYVYHHGNSESAVGEAVVKRYPRDSFLLATKLPAWELKGKEDRDRIFREQLERTGAGYFDYYLLHSIEEGNIEKYETLDCFQWGLEKKREGTIRHFGFSFHGSPELLNRVLDQHPEVEFVQIQLNYLDWDNPIVQSGKNYEILRRRGLPILVMEPVKGGNLAKLKPELEEKLRLERPERSIASWALRFAASMPGVMTVLSGMTDSEQIEDNLQTFRNFEPLSSREKEILAEVTRIMMSIPQIGCTSCRYCCDGCPSGIPIPDVFRALNTIRVYGDTFRPKAFYREKTAKAGKASECVACGQCEGVCPQHLPIIELMREAVEKLEG
jgi:predicted aldo/keto reductase-like oxidoreductase